MTILRSLSEFTRQPFAGETLVGVANARVLYADYDVLREDLRMDASAEQLDAWLLRETAFISQVQAAQARMNEPIVTTETRREGFRPPRYCRAAVFSTQFDDVKLLLDVKGCGIEPCDIPTRTANGLLTLHDALYELAMERLTNAALKHAGEGASTVRIYAIVDLGFDAIFEDGRRERAVVEVRRAYERPEFQWGESAPGAEIAAELMRLELVLRRYGISASSCGAMRFIVRMERDRVLVTRDGAVLNLPPERVNELRERLQVTSAAATLDGVNVQVTNGIFGTPPLPMLIDFGRYRLLHSFENVLYAQWERHCETLRGTFLMPDERAYVQPDPQLSMAHALDGSPWEAVMDAARKPQRHVIESRFERFLQRALSPVR